MGSDSHLCGHKVDNAAAYSQILVKVKIPDDNNFVRIDNKNELSAEDNDAKSETSKDEKNDMKFKINTKEAGIGRDKNRITADKILECLSMSVDTKKKLNCIKQLLYKNKFDSKKRTHDVDAFKYNKLLIQRQKFNNDLVDLTKSFSKSGKRISKFSHDYLDINDLLRTNSKVKDVPKDEKANKKFIYVFKLVPINDKALDFRRFIDLSTNKDYIEKKIVRTLTDESDSSVSSDESEEPKSKPEQRKGKPIRRFTDLNNGDIKNKILRTLTDDSDSSASSDESEEPKRKPEQRKGKLKRFQVIDKSESDMSSDVPMQRPIRIPKNDKPVILYMQAPTRILKIKGGRRRLTHFLPKRYHWNERDIKNLRNYWFSGPQGKYWGHYKTPY